MIGSQPHRWNREPAKPVQRPNRMMNKIRLTAVISIMALAVAACGVAQGSDAGSDDTEAPPVAGMCTEEQPDCQDTVDVPDDGTGQPDIQYRPIEPEGDVAGDGTPISDGELVAVDGRQITIGFWMGVEDCYAVELAEVEETEDLVKVNISVAARDVEAMCIEIAEARSVTLDLAAPLGDRVVQIGDGLVRG